MCLSFHCENLFVSNSSNITTPRFNEWHASQLRWLMPDPRVSLCLWLQKNTENTVDWDYYHSEICCVNQTDKRYNKCETRTDWTRRIGKNETRLFSYITALSMEPKRVELDWTERNPEIVWSNKRRRRIGLRLWPGHYNRNSRNTGTVIIQCQGKPFRETYAANARLTGDQ